MRRQSLIAFFTVSLLLITASSALITNCAETDAKTDAVSNQTPEFRFNDFIKISDGNIDTYLMQETVRTEDLFGNILPENCGEYVTVKAALTLDKGIRSIDIDVEVISGEERILSFSDTVTDDGISEENAWIYDGIIPTVAPMGIVADVQNAWKLIQELQDLLPKVSSNIVKEKIEKVLAKAVVKKIAAGYTNIPMTTEKSKYGDRHVHLYKLCCTPTQDQLCYSGISDVYLDYEQICLALLVDLRYRRTE